MSSFLNYILYLPAAALVFVFALALVAKFQPYKHKRKNTVDIILLLTIISTLISSSMNHGE
jgi:glucan phosphoethanolaminetransferase (alkaline phosphatase superfamily)